MKLVAVPFFALLSAFATVACSSSSSSEVASNRAELSGNVGSTSLVARSAIARYEAVATGKDGSTVRGLRLFISDKPNDCAALHVKSATMLDIVLPGADGSAATYAIVDSNVASATTGQGEVTFNAVDDTCADKVAEAATGGSLKVTGSRVTVVGTDPSVVSGTIDATFAGGHLNGTFDAIVCPNDEPVVADGGVACVP